MINDIINKYDNFILDIWGVIHNGESLIPHAREFIETLQERGKNFCLFSNAPRPSHVTIKKLHSLGLNIPVERVTTSGDIFISKLNNEYADKRIYLIGEEKNTDLLDGQEFIHATKIDESDYILMLAFGVSEEDLMQYTEIFATAIELKIPMLCPNPDIIVHHGNQVIYTPGAYARVYENMGGKTTYFGKPYKESYAKILTKYKMEPAKTIMIGDSLETDIKGAENAGIDSILVLTGIYGNDTNLDATCDKLDLKPKYILRDLSLHL